MKYTAPKAKLVELEVEAILGLSNLFCIVDDPNNSECEDKLPDFYG